MQPRRREGIAAALLCACAVAIAGCSEPASTSGAGGGSFKVLSKPAEKSGPALPDASIWEVALDDPQLEAGRKVWVGTCIQCHSTGLGGAPLIGNRDMWGPRIEKGLDVLFEHAIGGFYGDVGEMPARGGNAELTDDDIRAAVRFMTSRAS